MIVWIEVVGKQLGQEKRKRLKIIGETRWSGKSNAATAIFGRFDDPTTNTFVNLLTCLWMIHDSDKFDAKTKHEANVLLQFSKVWNHIDSIYLLVYIWNYSPVIQLSTDKWLDIFTAWSLVDSATTKLKEQTRTFHTFTARLWNL